MEIQLYKPFDYQRVVHDSITAHLNSVPRFTDDFQKTFVVVAPRQVGKSAMNENELIRVPIELDESFSAYIAPSFKQCQKTYDDIINMMWGSGVIKRTNSVERIIEYINGSRVQFFSAEQRDNLRGFTVSGILIIDEAAFISDRIYNECIMPWTDAKKAFTLMTSTPQYRTGFFHDNYQLGLTGLNNSQSFNFSDYDLSHIRSSEKIESKRKTTTKQAFKSEVLGLFLDAEGAVFDDFSDCILKEVPKFTEIYIGIDFGTGSGGDYTVLIGLNDNCEQVLLWKVNDMQPQDQIDTIASIINNPDNNVKGILAEQNSIGKVYLDMLRKKSRVGIIPFTTTNESKRKLVDSLGIAFSNQKIKIMNDSSLINELSLYEPKIDPSTNKIKYGAPNGYHDDCVMSLMLAHECYLRNKVNKTKAVFL